MPSAGSVFRVESETVESSSHDCSEMYTYYYDFPTATATLRRRCCSKIATTTRHSGIIKNTTRRWRSKNRSPTRQTSNFKPKHGFDDFEQKKKKNTTSVIDFSFNTGFNNLRLTFWLICKSVQVSRNRRLWKKTTCEKRILQDEKIRRTWILQ